MDRVNGSDWVDIGGGRRGFRSQNAAAGVPGTEVTDTILNDLQEEICAVIENSGFVLDPANQQQLWEALQSIAAPGFANRAAWLPVLSMTITNPPSGSALGDAYIIPAGATGVWTGHQQKLAEWTGASWRIVSTKDGHGVSLPDGRVFEKIGGTYIEKLALDDQSGKWTYAAAGGSANALTVTLAPAPQALAVGMVLRVKITTGNTGAATLNVNGLGAIPILTLKGLPLVKRDLPAGSLITLIYDGASWLIAGIAYSEIRQVLQSDMTVWVRPDGNDNNDGSANNADNAFATIQGCWNYIVNRFDGAGKTITIALGVPGTYDGLGATAFGGSIVIQGDPVGPSDSYIIRCRNNNTRSEVITSGITQLDIVNCVLSYTYTGPGSAGNEWILGVRNGGQINAIGCRYRMNSNRSGLIMNSVDSKCVISVQGNIQIQGAFMCSHFVQVLGAGIFLGGVGGRPATINLAAGQTYNSYFAQASLGGIAECSQTTFTGTLTPVAIRYLVSMNGTISVAGGGANFFPGTAAGVTDTSTGGVYA